LSKTEGDEDGDKKRDDLIFELIKRRIDNEGERTNSLDTKAGSLVGYVSVLVGLFLGGGSLLSGGVIFKTSSVLLSTNHIVSFIYFVGLAFLLVSIGCSLNALRVRKWIAVPNVDTLISDYITRPYIDVLQTNAVEMANAVAKREAQNNNKAKFIVWSWYLLIAGLCIIFASAIVLSASGGVITGAK
jgi:hypothetical protein